MTPRSFHIQTFGCQMNERDTEIMAGLLEQAGMTKAVDQDSAQVMLVNTCHVREHAEQRALSLMGRLKVWREAAPTRVLALTGCVAEARGEKLLSTFPQIDVILGPSNVRKLPGLIERVWDTNRPQVATGHDDAKDVPELSHERPASFRAWVKIMEGCDHGCAFCVVPTVRGPERSRPFDEIVAEVESLTERGVAEVTLLGQTVNAYGKTAGPKGDFAALLRRLAAVPGLKRLRFTSPHPSYHHERVLTAIAECPVICPHLHLPVQSGSDRMLKAMRRGYTASHYLGIIERARHLIPNVAVTSDVIVGFPGETEEDFGMTLALVATAAFRTAFTFKYSSRPGTPAADLPDAIPETVKEDRLARVNRLLEVQGKTQLESMAGQEAEVLVEGPREEGPKWAGRLPQHTLALFHPDPDAKAGTLRRIRIDRANTWTLDASLLPLGVAV